MPQLDVEGKLPGWSVEIIANSIADELIRWSWETGSLGGTGGGSERRGTRGNGSHDGWDRERAMFPMRSLVSSGQVAKKPLSIALEKVDLAGKPAVAWRNWARAILVG